MVSLEAIEAMEEVARERRATQSVFELIFDAIPHEDLPEADELQIELDELAEMDVLAGRLG